MSGTDGEIPQGEDQGRLTWSQSHKLQGKAASSTLTTTITPNDPNKDVKSSEDARMTLTNGSTSQEEGETAQAALETTQAAPEAIGDLVSNESN
jgi:hypothetical protein